jgi:isopentenyldiphosphate isomerase
VTAPGDELVDVVDDAGRTIGQTTRRDIRARRLPHRSVYVLVFNADGELFVHLRTDTKDVFPGRWDVAVGGVLAAGEDFPAAAARELHEELGVQAPLESLFPFRYPAEATQVHGMVYRARHEGPFHLQAEEIVRGEFRSWTTLDAAIARDRFCPDGLAVLAAYRARVAPEDPPCAS